MLQQVKQKRDERLPTVWRLSWPAIMEQILATMVSYIDTAMVGVMGAAATAAVSVNAAPIMLANGLLTGVGMGYSVQVSHAIGAGDGELTRKVIRQGALATAVSGGTLLLLFQLLAQALPGWLGAKPEVLPQAIAYLRYYTAALPCAASIYIFSAILRCMGNTRLPLCINATANLLNVVLNFVLIYPMRQAQVLGVWITIPGAGLGVPGAAMASAGSLMFAGAALLIAGFHQRGYRISFGDGFRPDRTVIGAAVRIGVPTAAERCTISLGQIAMTTIVASLSTTALAAHHIANTAEGMCYLPAYGVAAAGTALVGQAVGAKSREDAIGYGGMAARLGFLLTAGTAVLLFLTAPYLARLFNSDREVVRQAAVMLRIVSVAEPFLALFIVISGTLRGARDVRFPMIVSLVGMWGVRVVLTVLLVCKAGLGLSGVWIAMAIDLILRGILCAFRWHGGRWQRKSGLLE